MSRVGWVAWVMLAVWAAWLHAVQGVLAHGALGPWTPDVGVCLFVALAPRVAAEDLPKVACLLALTRAAFSIDPPVAIASGFLAASFFSGSIRTVIDLRSSVFRTVLAAVGAFVFTAWLGLAHDVRVAGALQFAGETAAWDGRAAWRVALATGCAAFVIAPVLARLPGLSPLLRRREWQIVASYP